MSSARQRTDTFTLFLASTIRSIEDRKRPRKANLIFIEFDAEGTDGKQKSIAAACVDILSAYT